MIWLTQVIFWIPVVVTVVIFLLLLRQLILKNQIEFSKLRLAIVIVIGVYLLQIIFRVILYYYNLRKSALGSYLLPGKGTNFFYQKSFEIFEPLLIGLLIGLFVIFVVMLLKKYVNRPLFRENDHWILFITITAVGYPNVFVLIIGSLLLMIIFKILQTILKRGQVSERLELAPFLLFSGALVLVLMNFPFYLKIYSLIY